MVSCIYGPSSSHCTAIVDLVGRKEICFVNIYIFASMEMSIYWCSVVTFTIITYYDLSTKCWQSVEKEYGKAW